MKIETKMTDVIFEAKLSDRLSFADNGTFRKLLEDMQASPAKRWVLNLSGLTSVDSAGLGMFIIAMETAKKAGTSLSLLSPSPVVKKLLELSRMDALMHIEY